MAGSDTLKLGSLSSREREILTLLAEGLPNKLIGVRLSISSSTVRTHLFHIYKKLGVHCRTEAVAIHFHGEVTKTSASL